MFNQQQQSQINSTLLNELLQVMSAFNAKICIEVQLLLWFLLWFGEGFETTDLQEARTLLEELTN